MIRVEHKPRPVITPGGLIAHFQWNYGWGHWEQVIDEAAGQDGVFAAYAAPADASERSEESSPRQVGPPIRDELSNLRDETARIVGTAIQNVIAESRSCVSYTPDEHVRLAADQIQALYVGLGRGLGVDYPEIPDSSSGADIAAAGPSDCAASETARKSEEALFAIRSQLEAAKSSLMFNGRWTNDAGYITDAALWIERSISAADDTLNPDRVMK